MTNTCYHEILRSEGFTRIGSLEYDFQMSVWWHQELRLELALIELETWLVLRATKSYRVKAMGAGGELYVRDLGALDAYLNNHFDEIHFWFSSFRDITLDMAAKRLNEKHFRCVASDEDISTDEKTAKLQGLSEQISEIRAGMQRDECLLKLNQGRSNLLQRHLSDRIGQKRRSVQALASERNSLGQRLSEQKHLENQYMQKAEGTCLVFSLCSNLQIANNSQDFEDALYGVVKELQDTHNYEIRQKLQGGKLQIFVEEIDAPALSLLTRWAGAVLNPRQLANLGPEFADLLQAVERELMVFPRKDILLSGSVQDEKKLVSARVVRNFLKKLEVVPAFRRETVQSPKSKMPVWIGNVPAGAGGTAPWELPLDRVLHTLVTGKTGSGKSFCARVIVEGCTAYRDVAIVILDPRDQWAGFLCPEDRPGILGQYKAFGIEPSRARSFGFTYYGLGTGVGEALPADLRELATGLRIVSFKGMDDSSRCLQFAKIMDGLFAACSRCESDRPRILIVVDESVRFTRKGVGPEDHPAAQKAEQSLERIAREGRKFGMQLLLCTQRATDYTHNTTPIRQSTTTRIFLQNSDTDIERAQNWLPDAREIVGLRPGEAFVCNALWGAQRIRVRPPLSKVWELSPQDVRRLVGGPASPGSPRLSRDARAVLQAADALVSQTGTAPRLATVLERLGITSRRKAARIVKELENASAARFEQLNERGRPLVILPRGAHKTRGNRT